MNDTKGTAVVTTEFLEYQEYKGAIDTSRKGAIVSIVDGMATAYGIKELEMHGTMFVKHGTKVRKSFLSLYSFCRFTTVWLSVNTIKKMISN